MSTASMLNVHCFDAKDVDVSTKPYVPNDKLALYSFSSFNASFLIISLVYI